MSRDRQKAGAHRAGAALRRLVDLISHRSGAALALMNEAAVTLPQVLLLSRVERLGSASLAELGADASASIPALSQMVDRLVQQELLTRIEDPADRRRKAIRLTARAGALLRKIESARSAEYERGLKPVSAGLRAEMAAAIERAIVEIEAANGGERRETGSARS